MADEKGTRMDEDQGAIGSAEELDEYGVWVKSEPQDVDLADERTFEDTSGGLEFDSADNLTIPTLDALPDFDDGMESERTAIGDTAKDVPAAANAASETDYESLADAILGQSGDDAPKSAVASSETSAPTKAAAPTDDLVEPLPSFDDFPLETPPIDTEVSMSAADSDTPSGDENTDNESAEAE